MLTRRGRVVLACAGALLGTGVTVVALSAGGEPADEPVLAAAGAPAPPPSARDVRERAAMSRLLGRAADVAGRHDGKLEVAAMLNGWKGPLVRATTGAGAGRPMRAWSMSKVLVAVALLDRLGWSDDPGKPLSTEVEDAMSRALIRSENCPQRRIVLELQAVAGGPAAARRAVADVLERAGAGSAGVATQVETPEPLCQPYLASLSELEDPHAPAVLFGTTTWTVGDAARFAHALATGVYGDAVSERLLTLMRAPKARSDEATPIDFTAPLDWGAGAAFAPARPAYKAGWGGTLQASFVAGQIVVLELPNGRPAALAIAFHPHVQPIRDDPGVTSAPAALTEALEVIAKATAQ